MSAKVEESNNPDRAALETSNSKSKTKEESVCHISPVDGGNIEDTATQEDDINDQKPTSTTSTTTENADDVNDVLGVKDSEAEEKSEGEPKNLSLLVDRKLEKMLADLEKEDWYHGCLPYEDIVGLIKSDGDFLLRALEPEGDRTAMACVTAKWDGKVRDYPVHSLRCAKERLFTIDGVNKESNIMTLVRRHHQQGIPIDKNVRLKKPVPKQRWELTSDKIKLVTKIGAGQFGEIWQGTMQESARRPPIEVAVKVKKVNDENKEKMDEMYKEARLMRQYKHKNIVTFYGLVHQSGDKVMIVMELVKDGALNDYLRKKKEKKEDVADKERIGYAIDVAIGLVYLHSKGCMHRDIACRNCLINLKRKIVKITDFGLSKQASTYKIKDNERLPIRWQAPEVILTRIYTVKCDVYSYGILVWEIFNDAEQPFKGMDLKTVRSKINDPKFRPPVDLKIPIVIQRVMRSCWRADPKKRPNMAQAARYLIHAPPEIIRRVSLFIQIKNRCTRIIRVEMHDENQK
ncbi:protein tyrosine kinase [Dictyocaulus viviparus]|uniref:Tyrosine-protein kinase n=1 Tax=Dictyocaulus viviparus TaxID=29172 RepID=A0A0D8XT01_DICVI|nr:protein tyrosine kinase [Dictyocaulus viviparus]